MFSINLPSFFKRVSIHRSNEALTEQQFWDQVYQEAFRHIMESTPDRAALYAADKANAAIRHRRSSILTKDKDGGL